VSKPKAKQPMVEEETKAPTMSVRFILTLLAISAGIAWIAYYYSVVRVDPTKFPAPKAGGPGFMGDWGGWNYVLGFALITFGLWLAAHPSTPLGRGRGVVVGMLGCFLLGLLWICVFYVFANKLTPIPVMNDLGQWNLAVGVGLMALGFSYATRWE
jgi:magnesium-transporting ATPase (P-type)